MRFFKPRFLLLALACALGPLSLSNGCAGEAFTPAARGTGGSAVGEGGEASESGASGGGSKRACRGPDECDDQDPCTTDGCGADGTCVSSQKCLGSQQCCGGDCADCCGDEDCDDGVSCTENTCFMGQCLYVPKDSQCEAGQFCSSKEGCRPRQACGILPGEDAVKVCDDADGCTADSCGADNFCRHDYCSKLCCPGDAGRATSACASECCNDAQCDTDRDPCTVGACIDGQCSVKPLCGDGLRCCPNADGKSASCGTCCTAADCDDHHGCTEDQCAGGHCTSTPATPDRCGPGHVCDLEEGCIPADTCDVASDCKPKTPCQLNPRCEGGACRFDSCSQTGTKCCATGCAACCSDQECSDNIACTRDVCGPSGCTHTPDAALCGKGQQCDPQKGCVDCVNDKSCDDGLSCTTDSCSLQNRCTHTSTCGASKFCASAGCVECLADSDCQVPLTKAAIAQGCTLQRCVNGTCQTKTETCDVGFCCPPYGCLPQCLQTQ